MIVSHHCLSLRIPFNHRYHFHRTVQGLVVDREADSLGVHIANGYGFTGDERWVVGKPIDAGVEVVLTSQDDLRALVFRSRERVLKPGASPVAYPGMGSGITDRCQSMAITPV